MPITHLDSPLDPLSSHSPLTRAMVLPGTKSNHSKIALKGGRTKVSAQPIRSIVLKCSAVEGRVVLAAPRGTPCGVFPGLQAHPTCISTEMPLRPGMITPIADARKGGCGGPVAQLGARWTPCPVLPPLWCLLTG